MKFEDFLKYFSDIQICKCHDDYKYNVVKSKTDETHAVYFKVRINKTGHYYLTVNQDSKRKYLPRENYRYSDFCIVFGRDLGNGKYEYVEGFQRADKEVWTEGELKAGEYTVYVKINWFNKKTRPFTFSVYGVADAEIQEMSRESAQGFLEKLYTSKGRTSKKLEDYSYYNVADCSRAVELTDDGFGFIYYQNNSRYTLEEELYFKVLEGLKFRKPYRGNKINVTVRPGEEKCVVTKVLPDAKRIR
mmetsp:Transcript_32004/g.28993  ORF Transcript_32004/g.28993 Transcript_32004/m.28993 type:complete len:246 (+) Transcript_32004:1190-1927(+)